MMWDNAALPATLETSLDGTGPSRDVLRRVTAPDWPFLVCSELLPQMCTTVHSGSVKYATLGKALHNYAENMIVHSKFIRAIVHDGVDLRMGCSC